MEYSEGILSYKGVISDDDFGNLSGVIMQTGEGSEKEVKVSG